MKPMALYLANKVKLIANMYSYSPDQRECQGVTLPKYFSQKSAKICKL
jgi:hypothetical protein